MSNISTLSQLQDINLNLAGDYVLLNDIDAADTATWNSGAGFLPIGTAAAPFAGTFDGGGYTISNLHINRPTMDDVGLLGKAYSNGANKVIKNVTLASVSITGRTYVGSIAGSLGPSQKVIGVTVSGSVTATGTGVGGLVGYNGAMNSVTITGISNCSSSAAVTGTAQVGGFVGANNGYVYECFASGNVTATVSTSATYTGVGGFIGVMVTGYDVTQCFSTGNVHGTGNIGVGGFLGLASNSAYSVTNCYSTGNVTGVNTGSAKGAAGGFVGGINTYAYAEFYFCYSIGSVTADTFGGGFIGYNKNNAYKTFYDCRWDTEASNQPIGYGNHALREDDVLTGLSTAQMGDSANFPAWDTSVWLFWDHPLLKWHDPDYPVPPIVPGGFWTNLYGTTQTFS